MEFNLLTDKWIPIIRRNGERELISPLEITTNYEENPVVFLDYDKSIYKQAYLTFLIGLFQTFMTPENSSSLKLLFSNALSKKELEELLLKYEDYFYLVSEKNNVELFLQNKDLNVDKTKLTDISFLDFQLAENSLNINDIYSRVKKEYLSLEELSISLISHQLFSSGRGNYAAIGIYPNQSMSIATLSEKGDNKTLWKEIIMNIFNYEDVLQNFRIKESTIKDFKNAKKININNIIILQLNEYKDIFYPTKNKKLYSITDKGKILLNKEVSDLHDFWRAPIPLTFKYKEDKAISFVRTQKLSTKIENYFLYTPFSEMENKEGTNLAVDTRILKYNSILLNFIINSICYKADCVSFKNIKHFSSQKRGLKVFKQNILINISSLEFDGNGIFSNSYFKSIESDFFSNLIGMNIFYVEFLKDNLKVLFESLISSSEYYFSKVKFKNETILNNLWQNFVDEKIETLTLDIIFSDNLNEEFLKNKLKDLKRNLILYFKELLYDKAILSKFYENKLLTEEELIKKYIQFNKKIEKDFDILIPTGGEK